MSPKISIAVPAFIDRSNKIFYLSQLLDSILNQTFEDYEVVISDHSVIDDIEKLCGEYSSKIKIVYLKNFYDRGIVTANANNSLKYCSGEYIKILHCDDFFVNKNALEKIVNCLDNTDKKWLVNGFNHTNDGKIFFNELIPKYPDNLLIGNNLMGGPTNVTIKNEDKEFFDTNIILGIDVEWYHRLRMKYGMPYILNDILTTSRIVDDRVSAKISKKFDIVIESDGCSWNNIQSELDYIQEKHKDFFDSWEYPNG